MTDPLRIFTTTGILPRQHHAAVELARELRANIPPGAVADVWAELLDQFVEADNDLDRQHLRTALQALHARTFAVSRC